MATIEARALGNGLRHPPVMARRVRFRLTAQKRCPVVYAISRSREVGEPRDAWLADVARTHDFYPAGA